MSDSTPLHKKDRTSFLVYSGNFFFRHRNALFPVLFLVAALTMRPKLLAEHLALNSFCILSGIVLAVAGELVRLLTIGYEYIERGGKEGKVYASRLVMGGMYSLTRNPMYLGNSLIAMGITLFTGSLLIIMTVIPFFLFVYLSIITAEEEYLRSKFGKEYDEYCAQVPRIFPSIGKILKIISANRYDWKSAVRKDLSTIVGLSLGLIVIPWWRKLLIGGWSAAKESFLPTITAVLSVLFVYALLSLAKKRRWIFY